MAKAYEKYIEKKNAPKKSYLQYIAEEEEAVQNRNDDIVKDVAVLAGQGATLGFGDELVGGVNALAGNDYEASRDKARTVIEGARERLPYVGPVIEAGGSVATSALVPGLGGGKWFKELGLAALEGYGENTDPDDLVSDIAFSTGVSAGANIVGGIAKKAFSQPEEILANSAGARGINYRKGEVHVGEDSAEEYAERLKDPAGLSARLDKLGFFKMGNKTFKGGKFVREGKLEEIIEPASLDTMAKRVKSGVENLSQENKKLLEGKKIPLQKVIAALTQAAEDFIPAGEDYAKRQGIATKLAETGIQDLVLSGALKPGSNTVDAALVEDVLKRKWQKKVAASYDSGKAVSDITDEGVQARRKFATMIDKLVDSYGGEAYKKNNDLMSDLLAAEKLIHNKTSRLRGYSGGGPRLTNLNHVWESLIENTAYHPQTDLIRARVGQGMRTPIGKATTKGLSRIPMEYMNSTIDQTPPVEVIENDPGHPMQKGRMPQSVPNIPEQFIRTPLPRNTQGLMQNKNFVLGKVAQMMPEMFEAVKDTYDHEPERLGEIAQVLALKMPHLFERDKYNRFDGRILSEADKQKAIKDTLLRQDISSIDQAKIITKLNKEGLF